MRLISTGGTNADAAFLGATGNGFRVGFATTEAIPGTGDTDSAEDLYERAGNAPVRLISTGGTNEAAAYRGASANGSRVWFDTDEAIPGSGDTNGVTDIYERHENGALRLISGGTGTAPSHFQAASADGLRVWFETRDARPGTGDTDTDIDVYERRVDGSIRLISP